jgi:hypothetical protein
MWNPPPAAAAVTLEELKKAWIKRQDSLHVFICPHLMKPEWFCLLYKASDIVFDVPVESSCWPAEMYELLILGIAFPYIRHPSWQLRGTPKMFYLARRMHEVWATSKVDLGHLLHNFLLEYEKLRTMSADVVWRLLYFEPQRSLSDQKQSRQGG